MKNLFNLLPGDEVLYQNRNSSSICKIDRITKTQIVLFNRLKFYKSTGQLVGGDIWSDCSILLVTDKIREQVHARKINSYAKSLIKRINAKSDKDHSIHLINTIKQFCNLSTKELSYIENLINREV